MDKILFKFKIEYGIGIKGLLSLPIAVVIVLGFLFLINSNSPTIFPDETKDQSEVAAIILFLTPIFIILIYLASLPRSVFILQDKIRFKYGLFNWVIPYRDILSLQAKSGIPIMTLNSSVTSLKNQIEIVRKHKFNIRISPSPRDEFLNCAMKCLKDWQNTHTRRIG
ncbi:MAG: hypothetical protein GTO16_05690 [Candidatus Aminicenantes bacterium]|nr:hypothetical protein [Candidatus Aminicenantes bacterium]